MTVYTFDSDIVSDLYKDAYGFRPNANFWEDWRSASDDVRQRIWDDLLAALEFAVQEQAENQRLSINEFESLVANNISLGASSRADAIAWLCDSYDVQNAPGTWGWEHLEYQMGLPFGYISGVKPGFKA